MPFEPKKAQFAYLIGALADGSIYHSKKHYVYRVTYYQHLKEYLIKCIESRIVNLFNYKGHFYFDKRKDVWFYEITKKDIFLTYKEAVESFKDVKDRSVPSWIKSSENSVRFAFVRGFFDADGWYYIYPKKSDYRVRFGQAEYDILRDIRDILSDEFNSNEVLGPYQSKEGAKPYYELHFYGIDQLWKFHNLIKPCHPEKQLDLIL